VGLLAHDQGQRSSADDVTQRWVGGIGLAVAVGVGYFLAADFSVRLLVEPEGVAVFWPAAGISSGLLIALGAHARWPVLAGVIVATVATHLIIKDPLWAGVTLGLCNAAEALVTAGLIQHYFGAGFNLVRVRYVFGLLAAAVAATIVSGVGGAATYRLMQGPSAPILNTLQHWFASDFVGIIAVAPVVIGLTAVVRRPSPRSEVIEGTLSLVALALITGFIISLPREVWETVLPITWLFPVLVWLAARYRPAFSAAGAFVVSITIVMTTILGKGHFGDPGLPIMDRVLGAQAAILVVALTAYVLAALFTQRKESAEHLTQSNMMLERERSNKLMNLEAMAASIAHEVRQPLSAIATNGYAALRFLGRAPPDHKEVRSALSRMISDSNRAGQVFDNIRALFGKAGKGHEPIYVNEIALEVLHTLRGELKDGGITVRTELTPRLPLVMGHRGQLQEVLLNLIRNAIEAMDAIKDGRRVLQVRTERHDDRDEIVVAVEDSGPGIDPEKLDRIFDAFVSTKPQGMGLGLAICRMIIDRHGGQLSASSGKRRGAVFQFILPRQSVDSDAARSE
jgi:signal transduction histidine kinase